MLQKRMGQLWTAQESHHKMPARCGLRRKQRQQIKKKYSLQESYGRGVLPESRKELAGVGVEKKELKQNLIGHIIAFCILTGMT